MKLTKAQYTFFEGFTKNAIKNLLISQTKPEYAEQVLAASDEVLEGANLKTLVEAIGTAFLAQTDFKTIIKVDKFLKSPEYLAVTNASSAVLVGVADELAEVLAATAQGVSAAVDAE